MSKIPTKRISSSPTKVVFRTRQVTTGTRQINPNARYSLNNALKTGDRVTINGKSGTIAFIGPTQFADGEWVGINLDEPAGKNDGSHDGVRYFETDANHGLFCRADKVKHLSINGAPQRNSIQIPSRLSTIESASNNILGITRIDKQNLSSTKNLRLHDRVIIRGEKYGTLEYIGKFHKEEGIFCGIKLDGPLGKHDGKIDGKRYFTCPPLYGVFASLRDVEKVVTNPNDSQTLTRQSIMSTDSFSQYPESTSRDSHLSEISTSSNEIDPLSPRSPKKIKQPILSADSTAMETSLSSQIANLLETVKEKDLIIGNLQDQHEKNRLELQRQNEIKENENELLRKEQIELTQRVEDLKFQLESNKNELIIPDDHRLLSLDEIRIYEEIKEKVVEFESINKKLTQEKQIFQEELKQYNELNTFTDELKKQIELLKLQVTDLQNKEQIKTTQLAEKETFYQQQIKEYQAKIEQITEEEQNVRLQLTTLEQEKQANDKQVNDLLNELKRHQESIIPDLEKQCEILKSELENRNQTVNMTLNEREIYYGQQIKEYQDYINQATHETEKIRAELHQIHEENDLKEKKTNALINELKQNYEKLQIELNDREHQVDLTLNQCEQHYEIELKEYENNLSRANRDTQNIQAELARLEEEKILNDNKLNSIINSLKQDYERQYEILKKQLTELQDQSRTESAMLNERIAHYEIEIKKYQIKIDEDVHEIQNLLDELKILQEEKTVHEQTVETLKQSCKELQTEVDELNERELKAHKTLHQREAQFDQQIEEYQQKLEQANLEIQHLQSELEKLQEEKTNFNDTINTLTQDFETLKSELEDRDQTENTEFSERENHYKSEIKELKSKRDESLLEIQNLQSKLTNLQEEKTTMENKLNQTINTLKQDYEKLLNKQELEANKYLQQIKEYEEKLEQADLTIQQLQSDLDKLQEEKTEFNDTINSLTQDLETLKTGLHNQDHYTSEIHEHKTKRDQLLLELQDLQSKLTNLQEEKTTMEDELNKTINTLKQDYEKLQNEQKQKEKQIRKEYQSQYEHEIDEYQKNLELSICKAADAELELVTLKEEKESQELILNDQINSLKTDFENQIKLLKKQIIELQKLDATKDRQLKEYQLELDQTNELIQRIENLTRINDTLKAELEDIKHHNDSNDIDQLNQQINDLQQMHLNLLEKQANREQEYAEEKRAQEKIYKEKIDDYEMKLRLVKNEFMVEMENAKLDHEQEILRLKVQIPKGKK